MHESFLPREFPGGRLRRLRHGDCESFQAYRRLPDLNRYQGGALMSDAEALAFLIEMNLAPLFLPGRWVQLGIAEPDTESLIGDIGLHLSEDGSTGEVGYRLHPSAQGRGIASGAVREAVQLLFTATKVTQVLAITDARNLSSIRLLERLGFKHQQTRCALFRGEPCTEKLYTLMRNDG